MVEGGRAGACDVGDGGVDSVDLLIVNISWNIP